MEVVREIRHAAGSQITVDVPGEFSDRDVEVIVLPVAEKNKKDECDRKTSFFEFVDKFRFRLPGDYKFVREELYDRENVS